MERVTVYHNPSCGKSRGALDILRERGVACEVVEYLKTPVDRATVERFLELLAGPPADLVRKDKRFRELGLDATKVVTREQVVDVLAEHPELMERPVVIRGRRAVIARPSEKVLELLEDPFEVFNASTGSGIVRNPYPRFAELRAACPVHEGTTGKLFDVPAIDQAAFSETGAYYTACSYNAVSQVLLDGETFSSAGYGKTMGLVMGHSILEMDEPEHHRYRNLLQQVFSQKAMERWERELVVPIVARCIDAFVGRGRADLVRELTLPFPLEVIAGMLGLPQADLPRFHRLAVELISIAVNIERGIAASQQLRDYFAELLPLRRERPGDDLMSVLAAAELDGQRLTDEEIFAFLRLLLPAGAETTYRSSSNLLFGLLTHPEQLAALRDDRTLMRRATEEGLRWEAPLTGIARTATRDVVVDGVPIPAGAVVGVALGAANHDPARWTDPERFDIVRDLKQHMAFAYGAHTCLGMHLARMETRVALDAVLDRLPNLRLDPDAEDVHVTGLTFRAPARLPVRFG